MVHPKHLRATQRSNHLKKIRQKNLKKTKISVHFRPIRTALKIQKNLVLVGPARVKENPSCPERNPDDQLGSWVPQR
jgi:hypothetical protein